jgi:hypothetical protein
MITWDDMAMGFFFFFFFPNFFNFRNLAIFFFEIIHFTLKNYIFPINIFFKMKKIAKIHYKQIHHRHKVVCEPKDCSRVYIHT